MDKRTIKGFICKVGKVESFTIRKSNVVLRYYKDILHMCATFVGSLKSAVSRYAHTMMSGAVWQPRYHDHAIRGVEDGNNISLYIDNNVANWEKDCFYRIEE